MKKRSRGLRKTVLLALLSAISIVCGKYIAINAGEVLRFSLENMPVIFAGMAFGVGAGALVGAVADIVGCLLVGYTINPLVTLGAAAVGAVSGLIPRLLKSKTKKSKVVTAITVASSHLVGSVLIKTLGLAAYYDMPYFILLLWRVLNYTIVGLIDGMAVHILLKNKGVRLHINELRKMPKMSYGQALNYIHGVSGVFCKPGLERISQLCLGLGNPEKKLKFIHIGGTNGKGSVSAMTESILRESGYKVGLYTSPYVRKFNERIRVNGENISDKELAKLTSHIKSVADKMEDKPTEFEIITAIAFEHFARQKCDIVVLEVGLGGRFDATNIITPPLLSIITGIALDHTAILGDTVEKIAFEKAGIIKKGSPVLYGGDDEGAFGVIDEICHQVGAELYRTDYSALNVTDYSLNGTVFGYRMRKNLTIGLLGGYQPRNAAIVLDAIDILLQNGVNVSEDAVISGLKKAKWPARFEIIHENPTVIFDGAHNPQGVGAAVESIRKYFDKKVVIFSGVLHDKDYMQIAKSISSVAESVFTITPDNPRALSAVEYSKIYENLGVKSTPCDNTEDAIKGALLLAKEKDTALCCLGSLYTYSSVIDAVNKV